MKAGQSGWLKMALNPYSSSAPQKGRATSSKLAKNYPLEADGELHLKVGNTTTRIAHK
jgi:hypothetical protein